MMNQNQSATVLEFNVIIQDFNTKKFVPYNILPHLINHCRVYQKKHKQALMSFNDVKELIQKESMYKWWSKCEYEIVLQGWPNSDNTQKVDVYWQIIQNLDLITQLVLNNIEK